MMVRELLGHIVTAIGRIDLSWAFGKGRLTVYDREALRGVLLKSNYIILTKRRWTGSALLIWLGNFLLYGRGSYWTHALMNVEGDDEEPKLMEAVGEGVRIVDWDHVSDVDAVCILEPAMAGIVDISWAELNERAHYYLGREYDSVLDILDDTKLNCVEYVWNCLKVIPNAPRLFHGLKQMIESKNQITPQMFYDSQSFTVVMEVRR